ncbi:UvrD-helicase domain-containing protein [Formosimonas limnophila]|uniref:UvrD-helicase domain-containing protein n=1 Tax=Formosimonas limnophila TaxID=1384487 RepID=UPI001673ECE3|nr:UvrD-helicase domain-containing protein [Formosimonas limnophila]
MQKRKTLEITSNQVLLDQLTLRPVSITSTSIKAPWYIPLWFGFNRLLVEYKTTEESQIFTFWDTTSNITQANEQIQQVVQAQLTNLIEEQQQTIHEIEERRTALYKPSRYVRHSQAHRFALNEVHDHNRAKSITADVKRHPMVTDKLESLINELQMYVDIQTASINNTEPTRLAHNQTYLKDSKRNHSEYFRSVESSPLTDEQIDAALTFEDITLVSAAAGSGKSSCIVGKVGFALKTELFRDDEILILAYNKDAATGLQDRLNEKLGQLLNRPINVASRTFHKFGLDTLIEYHGEQYRPKVFKEDEDEEGKMVKKLIADLLAQSTRFQNAVTDWYAAALYDAPEPIGCPDDIDDCEKNYEELCQKRLREKRDTPAQIKADNARKVYQGTIPTLRLGLYVRSFEERAIANWLFMRGVKFEYEAADWGGAKRMGNPVNKNGNKIPLSPDFTYTLTRTLPTGESKTITVIHEHFALNQKGQAPEWMGGDQYVQRAKDKRLMYQKWMKASKNTTKEVIFFETRSSQIRDGSIFAYLTEQLNLHGIEIGSVDEEIRQEALLNFSKINSAERLINSFVVQFKNSGLSKDAVKERAMRSNDRYRALLFLKVAFMVFDAYEAELKKTDKIDFADMLHNAMELLQSHNVKTPYRCIMVDEFQDISGLRADLIKAILAQSPDDSVVFCVGDDWQTINRFAGSDVGIFTDVAQHFERHTQKLELTTTFRCAQGIADVSRALIMKNPNQMDKHVNAFNPVPKLTTGVRLVLHDSTENDRKQALVSQLEHITKIAPSIGLPHPTVLLLRRTRRGPYTLEGMRDDEYLDGLCNAFKTRMDIKHMTMHGSKGLEADFVIVLGLDSGERGFPSSLPPEPLYDLVLPEQKSHIEEERRLFYVALTRAKHQAIVLTDAHNPSLFIRELSRINKDFDAIRSVDLRAKAEA